VITVKSEFLRHPKVLRAIKSGGFEAIYLWLSLKGYCSDHLTDGFIPVDDVDGLVDGVVDARRRKKAMGALLGCGRLQADGTRGSGLLERVDHGFLMHDYLDHEESSDEARHRRALKAARQKRWRNARSVDGVDARVDADVDAKQPSTRRAIDASPARARAHVPLTSPLLRSDPNVYPKDPTGSPRDDDRGTPPDPRCSCPRDLQLTGDQLATLEVGGVPQWAAELITSEYVAAAVADQDDRRTPVHWRKCLAKAVMGRWNDPTRRPKKPEDPEQRAREGAAARERYKASVERQRAKVRQKLTAGAKTSQRPADGEQPTIPKLLAGIGGNDD